MKRKCVFKFFTIVDYDKEQEYLREMHKSGWKLVSVSGFCMYHFEKCEPEDVIYQLDYNKDGLKNKDEYVKMFNDCGWEYLQDYVGYSYFRRPASATGGSDQIFCDRESRLEMMRRVFSGRVIPLVILFTVILLPMFVLNIVYFYNYWSACTLGIIIVIYLYLFISFAVKYSRYKNENGN
jgi:hypothetical protein